MMGKSARLYNFVSRHKPTHLVACLLLFAFFFAASAQTGSPNQTPSSPQSPEAARVDELINESRQLMMKGSFTGIAEKGEEALKLSQKIGDKGRQARALMYVALGRFHIGRTEEAIEPFKQSAALAAEAGDRALQTRALNAAGVLLEEAGRLDDALYFFRQSLALAQERKDLPNEATALRNVGRIYTTSHDYVQSEAVLLESLKIARDLQDLTLEHGALDTLARLENERKNFEQARVYEIQSHRIESPAVPSGAKYQLLTEEAITLFELADFEKCREVLMQALEFARSQKILPAEATILGNLADLHLKQGNNAEALAFASQSLALLRRVGGDPVHEALVLYSTARAQRQLGKADDALRNLRQAITLLDRARVNSVPTESARAQLSAKHNRVFAELVSLLVARDQVNESLSVSESYHGRAFLDSLVESRSDLARVLPKDLVEQEDRLLNQIARVQKEIWQEGLSPEQTQNLKQDLSAAEKALEQFHLDVRRSNPQYASLKYLRPLTMEQIQRDLLDSDTGLIEYFLGEDKSFVWLVSKNKVSYAALPSEHELGQLVSEYRKAIAEKSGSGKGSPNSFSTQSRKLYATLLKPLDRDLSALRKLIIVTDGSLSYLPFESLLSDIRTSGGSGYLLERFAISYQPSASALAAIENTGRPRETSGIVAFGDPAYPDPAAAGNATATAERRARAYLTERGLDLRPLPYTRIEVNSIGALFAPADRKVFLGPEANEKQVKVEPLERYRYIHFAAHGIVDEENPARSGVVLSLDNDESQDGLLQMTEIMRLKLNSDLVTLSACRTGLGQVVGGEGVLGLTRAFLYAGSRSVTASLWNVNDAATAELMTTFYGNLKRGLPRDEALRQAKLRLLRGKQPTWRQPYYWAPFVLIGANK